MADERIIYNSQLDAFTLYHIINDTSPSTYASSGPGPALPALGHALAGSIATACSKALTYPLDLVTTRLQVQKQLRRKGETGSAASDAGAEYGSLLDAARKIHKHEGGVSAFFTGVLPDVSKGVVDSFLFFLAYSYLRNAEMQRTGAKNLSVPRELGVGVVAGSVAKFVSSPIQNVVTRQQTAALVAARNGETPKKEDVSVAAIARQIYAERGLLGFWAGYGASIILTINPSITFAVDNLLHRLLQPKAKGGSADGKAQSAAASAYLTFLIAALSKAVATTITYPVQLAKSRAQAVGPSPQDEEEEHVVEKSGIPSSSAPPRRKKVAALALKLVSAQYAIVVALRKIYASEGLAGLYSGLEADVIKGFLSHGITMSLKEQVHVAVIRTYYAVLKLLKKFPTEHLEEGVEKVREEVGWVGDKVKEEAERAGEEVRKVAEDVVEAIKKD